MINRCIRQFFNRHIDKKPAAWLVLFGVVISIFAVIIQPAQAATGINKQINFQGKVVNSNGTNVTNGSYDFEFKLYTVDSAGTAIWTETRTTTNQVTVTDGVFRVSLGEIQALPGSVDFNTDNLYLSVNFNNDGEMSPRVRFTAVPYAFNAEKVSGLTVTATTGTLTIPTATIAFSGNNDVTLTSTGTTTVTLPTTGTLSTLDGTETLSNKTIDSTGLAIESTGWFGIGSSAGRVVFTDDTVDQIALMSANVGIGTTTTPRVLTVEGAMRLNSTAEPASPALGDIYTNVDGNIYFYNGTGWDDLTSGGAGVFTKTGTNLSPTTAGDDLYLATNELLGVGYDPAVLSGAVAAFSGNVGIGTSTADSKLEVLSGDTTRALQIIGNSVTTGEVIDISADGLTTGYAMNLNSDSNNLSTGGLLDMDWSPSAKATASGDLFKLNLGPHADVTGNLLSIYDNGSDIFLVATAKITSAVPHEFTAVGDVGIAYDLVFTNQTSSLIESYGPLTIRSGESFENLDLTLDPSGTGAVVIADGSNIELYADQQLIFDADDSSNSYIQFDNTNNRVEIFADASERFRFTASGNNESNGTITTTLSDLAENYPTMNEALTAGDIVMIATQDESAPSASLVDLADTQKPELVLGVVSSNPGIVLGGSSFLSDICQASVVSEEAEQQERLKLLRDEYRKLVLTEIENNPSATLSANFNIDKIASMSAAVLEPKLTETTIKTIDDRLDSCEAVKQAPVALAGRVPVKFEASKGQVLPGDLLALSSTKAGYAVKASNPGWVIGRALAPSTSDSETVMMFVNISWYGGNSTGSTLGTVLGDATLQPNSLPNEYLSTSTINGMKFLISSTNVSVFGQMTATTVNALDSVTTGMLTINGKNNEITTLNGSVLKLQSALNAGNIEAFNKKIMLTAEGNVIAENEIHAKRFKASEDSRGSVYATTHQIRVEKQWQSIPASVTLTPEFQAAVWVSDLSKDGFTINTEPISANKKIFWWAVW